MRPPQDDAWRCAPARATVTRLTPPGEGGITVLRLAGPDAARVLAALFVSPRRASLASAAPGQLLYGRLVHEGQTLDEAIVCRAPSPQEQCVYEINCHGGAVPARRVLEALAAFGVRQNTWSQDVDERRRNGEMDAVQAEAGKLLPRALTRDAAAMLLAQSRGALSRLLRHAADRAAQDPALAASALQEALLAAPHGRRLAQPARVAVAGRPNAGKSSLVNALLRAPRVIVSPHPGATRDTIEAECEIAGLPVLLIDTAGVRPASDHVEQQAVARALGAVAAADAVLLVLDASQPLTPPDTELLVRTRPIPRRLVLNKSDLPPAISPGDLASEPGPPPLAVSAATGQGIASLEQAIRDLLIGRPADLAGPVPFTERQENLIRQACAALASFPPQVTQAQSLIRQILADPAA
ncbi:MAG TPA: 50S ribosome-binding GTPase [Candidatus Brocadiia bacterium]|nr:50S ribosome-binding GTPase [Candidatus Brocadiia bacterium]